MDFLLKDNGPVGLSGKDPSVAQTHEFETTDALDKATQMFWNKG
ncbi:hypothetical protein [Agrobacterium tumefaciens]